MYCAFLFSHPGMIGVIEMMTREKGRGRGEEHKLTGVLEPVALHDLGALALQSYDDGGGSLHEVLPRAQEMRDAVVDDGRECAAPEMDPLPHLLLAPGGVAEGAGDRHHASFEYGVRARHHVTRWRCSWSLESE